MSYLHFPKLKIHLSGILPLKFDHTSVGLNFNPLIWLLPMTASKQTGINKAYLCSLGKYGNT